MTILAQAIQALAAIRHHLADRLVAVYLHGSAVRGGLRSNSDIDLLAVVDKPLPYAIRRNLVGALTTMSRYPPTATVRPLELIILNRDDLAPLPYPARAEFIYGEWLRAAFDAGEVPEPVADPDLTIVLASARQVAKPLCGPDAGELLPAVPAGDIRRAIGDALPALLRSLDGDERNVLLTLARMWRTLATGEIVAKDVAAAWAAPRLPPATADLMDQARQAYRDGTEIDWPARRRDVDRIVDVLRRRVQDMS